MDVEIVRWPAEEDRRDRLQREHVPRLLLVEEGEPPPAPPDCLEDWVRLPAPETEMAARVAAVMARSEQHGSTPPTLDEDGVLRVGQAWVSLPPVEARLTAALLERQGTVVSREALSKAGWPAGAPGRNALDVHVVRLRRRLAAVGLAIRTVRSRGYLLEANAGGTACSS